MSQLLTISPSPHVKGSEDTSQLMYGVLIALIPATLISIIFFGFSAIKVIIGAVGACILFEYLIQRFFLKKPLSVFDGSAALTGLLLAFNVPSSLPLWMVIVGSLFTIAVGKMAFGGLGCNPFNPALVGRVFLLISFPVEMTSWPRPQFLNFTNIDSATGATVLGIIKEGLKQGKTVSELIVELPKYSDMFWGQIGGSLGEISAAALMLGGGYLLVRKIITWHIPVSYLLTVFVLSGIFWLVNPQHNMDPIFHLLSGGLMLGAFFMATDLVTSPMTSRGMLVFGVGCGFLTVIIRLFGAYPEGVSFAILIMNGFVPLINKYIKPKRFGIN